MAFPPPDGACAYHDLDMFMGRRRRRQFSGSTGSGSYEHQDRVHHDGAMIPIAISRSTHLVRYEFRGAVSSR